jgi:hypothetical protein
MSLYGLRCSSFQVKPSDSVQVLGFWFQRFGVTVLSITVGSKNLPSSEPSPKGSCEVAASMANPYRIKVPYRTLRNAGVRCWLPSVRTYLVASGTAPCMVRLQTMVSGCHNNHISWPVVASQLDRRDQLLVVDDIQELHSNLANLAYILTDPSVGIQVS